MEMQLFKEGALKLEYEKEALDARASDSDDSAAPSIRSRSPFNWKTSKNNVSSWFNDSNLHDYSFERAKTRIDNNYPRVSFNREGVLKSRSPRRERVSSAREQDKSKRNKPSSSSQLPKLKLSSFDGKTLEWPEWSNMFRATVYIPDRDIHNRDIPEKMSHLKTLLTGKAKSAISGTGYSGEFYAQAWELLGRKFGRPYLIVDAQLNTLRKQQPIRMHDSTSINNYSITISNLVNVLKQYNYEGDLRSSSTLQVAIEKLPPNFKEKWFIFVDECQEDRPDLTLLEKWSARKAFVHEGMPSTKSERKEDERPKANKEKRCLKSSIVSASSKANGTKQKQNKNCPLADGTLADKIWNCPVFRNMNVTDRYAAVRKEHLCYGCLGKGMQSNIVKSTRAV